MRLGLAVTDFLLSREGVSQRTLDWYAQHLNAFLKWCDTVAAVRDTSEVNANTFHLFLRDVRALPGHLGRGTVSTQTVHGYARTLRAFLAHGVRKRWFDPVEKELFRMPTLEGKLIPAFSPHQFEQLLAAAERRSTPFLRARDQALLLTLLDTGVRASELLGLTTEHLHLSLRDAYVVVHGKRNKWREIGPLGRRCQRALVRYLNLRHDDEPHVFQTDDGQPLTLSGLDSVLKWLRAESGVAGVRVSAHTFRHTFAVGYLQQPGADIYKLCKLMGHTSVATTQLYLKDFQQREARRGLSVADHFGGAGVLHDVSR